MSTVAVSSAHRRHCVTTLLLACACLLGAVVGTLKGSGPAWPSSAWWATFAMLAAASIIAYLIWPTYNMLCLMSCTCICTYLSRAFGNLLFPSTSAATWIGTSIWFLLAVYHASLHKSEYRRHFA